MAGDFTNIAGGPFQPYVSKQIEVRKKFLEDSNKFKNNNHVLYQNNRNSFVRLTSSVNLDPSHPLSRKYNMSGEELAKKYILQGGIVSINDSLDTITNRGGIGLDKLYGTLPNRPLGFKPMPGITFIDISSAGKLGTLQYATVKFICHDIEQLELMDALYMKLGFSIVLEWGHTFYLDNDNTSILQKPIPLDVFKLQSKEEVIKKIQNKRVEHSGNYDAMLGTISNFSWDTQSDGSYSCEIKLVGAGDILESLKINQAINQTTSFLPRDKYSNIENEIAGYDSSELRNITSLVGDRDLSILNRALFDISQYILTLSEKSGIREVGIRTKSYRNIINNIFTSSPNSFFSFDENGDLVGDNEVAKRGNHYSLLSGLENNINNIPELQLTLFNAFGVNFRVNDNSSSTNVNGLQPQTYITLGNLLSIITCTGMLYDSYDGIKGKPYVYADFNDSLNFCSTFKGQFSLNPLVCIVPRNQDNVEDAFNLGLIQDKLFSRLNGDKLVQNVSYGNNSGGNYSVSSVSNVSSSEIKSGKIKNEYLNTPNNDVRAKMMHILVNINHITDILRDLRGKDEKNVIPLSLFINTLLSDISKSLGGFNEFRILVDDNSKSFRIIDDNKTLTEGESNDNLNYTEIPILGNKSLVYNYNFKSKIGPKMASMVTIAAQAEPSTLGEDSFAISNLSRGLKDRLMPVKLTSGNITTENNVINSDSLNTLKIHMKNILEGKFPEFIINTNLIEPSLNTYKEILANYRIKKESKSKGNVIIPLDFNINMDGISGIIPNSAFTIPTNLLPSSYITKDGKPKIAFILHKIDQSFENNKWTTKITGQALNIRFDKEDIIVPLNITPENEVISTIGTSTTFTQNCSRRANSFFNRSTVNIPIDYLKKAAQKVGLISPQAIASLIAIASGESGLVPRDESHIYSNSRIRQIFPYLTENQYKRALTKGISKRDFFRIVYGEYNPTRVGNRNVNDGGLYYGRGYIQLTGHGNYKRYANLSGVDILTSPELLNDLEKGALIAAHYFKDRVKVDQYDPNYFEKALKAVGYNVGDIREKKVEYYNCYLNKI